MGRLSVCLLMLLVLLPTLSVAYSDYYELPHVYVVKTKTSGYPVRNWECKLTIFLPNYTRYFAYPPIRFPDGTENLNRTKQCTLDDWTLVDMGTLRKWKVDPRDGLLKPLKKGDIVWLRVLDD